jgi:hypothetical protein
MSHQQFIVLPPLSKIAPIFTTATGRSLVTGVSWSEWNRVPAAELEKIRPYIRPCHSTMLDRAIAGSSPQALLRQLLRPYDYRIEAGTVKGSWVLRQGQDEEPAHVATVGEGRTVTWAD